MSETIPMRFHDEVVWSRAGGRSLLRSSARRCWSVRYRWVEPRRSRIRDAASEQTCQASSRHFAMESRTSESLSAGLAVTVSPDHGDKGRTTHRWLESAQHLARSGRWEDAEAHHDSITSVTIMLHSTTTTALRTTTS